MKRGLAAYPNGIIKIKEERSMKLFGKLFCSIVIGLLCLAAITCCVVGAFYVGTELSIVFGVVAIIVTLCGSAAIGVLWI